MRARLRRALVCAQRTGQAGETAKLEPGFAQLTARGVYISRQREDNLLRVCVCVCVCTRVRVRVRARAAPAPLPRPRL